VIVIEAFLKYLERFLRASRSSCLAFLPTTRPRGSADYLFHCSHHRIHELSGMKEERKTVMFHRKRSKNDPLHCHQKKKPQTPVTSTLSASPFATTRRYDTSPPPAIAISSQLHTPPHVHTLPIVRSPTLFPPPFFSSPSSISRSSAP